MNLPPSYQINDDIICQEMDGQMVLLNPITGDYFGLDALSAHIWQLLQELGSADDVLECMCEAFNESRDKLQQDLAVFLSQLEASSVISIQDS